MKANQANIAFVCLFVCVAWGAALFCASLRASTRMLILVFACASFSFKRKRLLIVKKNILLIVACARDEEHNVSGLFHPCLAAVAAHRNQRLP